MNRYELYHDGSTKIIDVDTGKVGTPFFGSLYIQFITKETMDKFEVVDETTLLDLDSGIKYPMEIKWEA